MLPQEPRSAAADRRTAPGAAGHESEPDLPRPVDVLHEGRWVRGVLLAAYRCGDRWRGVVRYGVAPGEQYQQARWAEELRAAGR